MTDIGLSRRTGAPPAEGRSGRAAAMPVEQRRAAIVTAAAPLFRLRGHDVTTREIAEAAGIAEGTVFRVFPTKQAVVDAVLADAYDLTETVGRIRAVDPAATLERRVRDCTLILRDRLSAIIDLMIALRMHGPPEHVVPRSTATGSRQTDRWRARRDYEHRESAVIAAVADVLAPDAERLTCSPERAAHLLRLLTFAGTHRMINDSNPLGPDEIADVLLHGIARAPDPRCPAPDPDG